MATDTEFNLLPFVPLTEHADIRGPTFRHYERETETLTYGFDIRLYTYTPPRARMPITIQYGNDPVEPPKAPDMPFEPT